MVTRALSLSRHGPGLRRSRMFRRESHISVRRVSQECQNSLTRVSEESHKSLKRVSQESHKSLTRVSVKPQKSLRRVSCSEESLSRVSCCPGELLTATETRERRALAGSRHATIMLSSYYQNVSTPANTLVITPPLSSII